MCGNRSWKKNTHTHTHTHSHQNISLVFSFMTMNHIPDGMWYCDTLYIPMSLSTYKTYEGWNFNSGNYLFTTDTK